MLIFKESLLLVVAVWMDCSVKNLHQPTLLPLIQLLKSHLLKNLWLK